MEAVLYASGVFLPLFYVVAIGVAFFSSSGGREVNILGTALAKCYAHNSVVYWIMRGGDLQFYLEPASQA